METTAATAMATASTTTTEWRRRLHGNDADDRDSEDHDDVYDDYDRDDGLSGIAVILWRNVWGVGNFGSEGGCFRSRAVAFGWIAF